MLHPLSLLRKRLRSNISPDPGDSECDASPSIGMLEYALKEALGIGADMTLTDLHAAAKILSSMEISAAQRTIFHQFVLFFQRSAIDTMAAMMEIEQRFNAFLRSSLIQFACAANEKLEPVIRHAFALSLTRRMEGFSFSFMCYPCEITHRKKHGTSISLRLSSFMRQLDVACPVALPSLTFEAPERTRSCAKCDSPLQPLHGSHKSLCEAFVMAPFRRSIQDEARRTLLDFSVSSEESCVLLGEMVDASHILTPTPSEADDREFWYEVKSLLSYKEELCNALQCLPKELTISWEVIMFHVGYRLREDFLCHFFEEEVLAYVKGITAEKHLRYLSRTVTNLQMSCNKAEFSTKTSETRMQCTLDKIIEILSTKMSDSK